MNNGKAKVETTMRGISITIPSKKNWFVLLFATFWLGGWLFGETIALGVLGFGSRTGNTLAGINMFMLFWLLAWTVGGVAVITLLLWGYFGKEKLVIEQDEVKFEKTVFGIGQKKVLVKNQVTNFRLQLIDESMFGGNRWTVYGMGPGKIKFDYGFKTYSFGLALDEAEANHLVTELNKYSQGK